jgi:predicted small integral membrane protein
MWIKPDEDRFKDWERKSPNKRVEVCAEKVAEDRFNSEIKRYSLFFRLVESLGRDAIKQNPLPSTDEAADVFESIEEFVCNFYYAATGYSSEGKQDFWRHRSDILEEARRGENLPFTRQDIEGATDAYLQLPYRSSVADRTLVDMLIAAELFIFGQHVFEQRKVQRFFGRGPLGFIVGRGCALVLAALLGGAAYLLMWLGILSEDVLVVVLIVIVGLILLEAAWAILRFPFAWRAQTKHNSRTAELLSDMNGVYYELNSTGPISARHIRERAQQVSAKGAVWPGPLFVLLEDIIERGGRM